MKVLFLDIDGVCNSRRWFRTMAKRDPNFKRWHEVDPELVKLVRQIIKETNCRVVLSSTWRLYPEARNVVRQKVCYFIDVTKDLQAGAKRGVVDRGYEVQEWLDRHDTVTQYAILDDDADFMPEQWLFKTTFDQGLTPDIAEAVIHHLNAADSHA